MCKKKREGGLGFHDIVKFNQYLLGKQAWRIMSNPDSLVARVLSRLGNRPFYAWKSILHGRDLLSQGLVRDIGNCEHSNVWSVNWIIDPVPRTPNYRPDSIIDLTLKISGLLLPNSSSWDVVRVREAFTDQDAEIILRIRPKRNQEDGYKWDFTKDGVHSLRSGYNIWSSQWKIKAPAKIKHFLWKALSGQLLLRKGFKAEEFRLILHVDNMPSPFYMSYG